MAYSHAGYTLHRRDVNLKGGRTQTIYFFARGKPKSGNPSELPTGFTIGVNPKTRMPYLKRT